MTFGKERDRTTNLLRSCHAIDFGVDRGLVHLNWIPAVVTPVKLFHYCVLHMGFPMISVGGMIALDWSHKKAQFQYFYRHDAGLNAFFLKKVFSRISTLKYYMWWKTLAGNLFFISYQTRMLFWQNFDCCQFNTMEVNGIMLLKSLYNAFFCKMPFQKWCFVIPLCCQTEKTESLGVVFQLTLTSDLTLRERGWISSLMDQ